MNRFLKSLTFLARRRLTRHRSPPQVRTPGFRLGRGVLAVSIAILIVRSTRADVFNLPAGETALAIRFGGRSRQHARHGRDGSRLYDRLRLGALCLSNGQI